MAPSLSPPMWYAAHRQLQAPEPIVARHHPNWLRLEDQVTSPIIQFWVDWHRQHGSLPPGIVTVDGLLVDGNHRFAACRQLQASLWCAIVRPGDHGVWLATGGVALVRPA